MLWQKATHTHIRLKPKQSVQRLKLNGLSDFLPQHLMSMNLHRKDNVYIAQEPWIEWNIFRLNWYPGKSHTMKLFHMGCREKWERHSRGSTCTKNIKVNRIRWSILPWGRLSQCSQRSQCSQLSYSNCQKQTFTHRHRQSSTYKVTT